MANRNTTPAVSSRSKFGLFIALSLVLSACSFFAPDDTDETGVGPGGAVIEEAGAKIGVPAGAVAADTTITAAFDSTVVPSVDAATGVRVLSDALKITLGDEAQPAVPLSVELPVDRSRLVPEMNPGDTIALLIQSENDSTPELVPARWNESTGTITAEVPHLSWMWPIQIDVPTLIKNVEQTILKGWNIETDKPMCSGETALVGQTEYSAVSPAQAWVCVSERAGELIVDATPNSPIPFLVRANPSALAGATTTEATFSTALSSAIAKNLGLYSRSSSILTPGTASSFTFDGEPQEVTLTFEQYPVILLVAILSTTLDTALNVGAKAPALDAIETVNCMGTIANTDQTPGEALSASKAASVIRAFFACAEIMGDMTPAQKIILTMLGAGPQFLITSALGIVNEMTGQGRFTVTIDAEQLQQSSTAGGKTYFATLNPWLDEPVNSIEPAIDGSAPSDDSSTSTCTASNTSDRSDAYRCFALHGVYDPCFQHPEVPGKFACLVPTDGIQWQILENMPVSDQGKEAPPAAGSPILVELSDGTLCSRASGAGPQGVPGYPYWAGVCRGAQAGVWRTNDQAVNTEEAIYRNIYGPTQQGYWQIAISAEDGSAPVQLHNIETVYN